MNRSQSALVEHHAWHAHASIVTALPLPTMFRVRKARVMDVWRVSTSTQTKEVLRPSGLPTAGDMSSILAWVWYTGTMGLQPATHTDMTRASAHSNCDPLTKSLLHYTPNNNLGGVHQPFLSVPKLLQNTDQLNSQAVLCFSLRCFLILLSFLQPRPGPLDSLLASSTAFVWPAGLSSVSSSLGACEEE